MTNKFLYNVVVLIFISFIFSKSSSRVITTIDPPSTYSIISSDINTNEIEYNNELGINFSYEHLIINTRIFNTYIGSEFMLGRKSVATMSFHSLYFMPSFSIKEKFALNMRLGVTQLNTDQDNFPINSGYLGSIGIEYQVSEQITLGCSYTMYDMVNKEISSLQFDFPSSNGILYTEPTDLDLAYDKIGLSIIYGFSIDNKGERNEKK